MAGVRTTHKSFDDLLPVWQLCRDAIAGQRAIRAGGKKYMEPLDAEDDAAFQRRIRRSGFFNATSRTVYGLKGMAFRKAPAATLPAGIEKLCEDVTLSGVRLDALAKTITEEVLSVGRIGLLVDHPPRPENVAAITLETAQRLGLRPTLQTYPTESIRNWRFGRVNNAWVLVLVVLAEAAEVGGDEFEVKSEDRWRVLDLIPNAQGVMSYRQRVFRINDKGEDEQVGNDIFPLMNGNPLPYIPFRIVSSCETADGVDDPPLVDLVERNVEHYQVGSVLRHTQHYCPPVFYVAGYTLDVGEVIKVGGDSALVFPNPDTKVGYAEPEGEMVPSIQQTLQELKQEMAVLGARMLADETQASAETLGGTQIKRAGENSILADIVINVSEAIEWALGIFTQWAGASGEISYQINREFLPVILSPQQLTALVAAWQSGALSEAELFDNLKRGDVIDPVKTLDEHQEEVGAQGGPVRPVKQEKAA